MEEMPPAVALSFRTANSTCDNSMEIACLKLITETAGLLPNSMDAVATSLSPEVEQSEAVAMEEGGDGDDLDVCRAVGSFQEDLVSMEHKFLGGIACSSASSIGSGSRGINSTAGELLDMDLPSETCTPTSLQAEKSVTPIVELATQEDQHSQASSSSKRSVFLVDYIPFWGQVSICGRRPEMEDAVVAVPYFYEIPLWLLIGNQDIDGLDSSLIRLPAHFFGVYDGHGGSQVADYCRERIHHVLIEQLRNCARDLRSNTCDDWKKQWERAFINCFQQVDDEVGGKVTEGNLGSSDDKSKDEIFSDSPLMPIAPETVGSTAVVAVICSSHIIIANCGDSRAVLCRGKQPVPLSVDHKPNREDEYARIEAQGGKVIHWNGYRVFGVLAMSRSIGDHYLKPWIIPVPEVTIVPRCREDECLILASDGLWDVMSNEEVCDIARKRILLWHKKNGIVSSPVNHRGEEADPAAQAAADCLSKLAIQKGSKDNITVIVVDLKAQRKFKTKS
ncbi:hypothetical protein OPV22_033804 [Ensete ventricosum]|uniref:protein-serine/threonine phosphatase n=1 Tax=Ensete ventricosum TaxID=4639 RepID=A0AAV8Q2E5_ENSVE|nr:hypothetical protein OPV22_033804 [Ensete ventricosum]